jgi:effector-binding domain-containing protein
MIISVVDAMAIEESQYTLVNKDREFEIRDYAPHILAEIIVEGNFEEAGNKAFNTLFRYISGDNQSRRKVAMTAPVSQEQAGEKIKMTAPVSQEQAGEKIAMTAPVGQQRSRDRWAVSFMMPASYTMETLPVPADTQIVLREVPARRIAAVRYSGFWSEKAYLRNRLKLESWIRERGLAVVGDPIWARYNAPFTPWFLRRNEILIPIASGAK